jgi:very-short-patch-repair endonuclease
MSLVDDRLLPVFVRQHWLVSFDDVVGAGGTADTVSHRLRTGRWTPADTGVYRLVGPPVVWESRLLAPILSVGAPAAASHHAAAALHRIPGFGDGSMELSVPRMGDVRRPNMRVHTSTDLDRCRIVEKRGIPTTDIDRTLLDLARFVGPRRLHRAIEWCRREDLTDWPSLIACLARHARRGRPGVQRLRDVILANADQDEVTDSDFELLFLAALAERGLPAPVLHHRVTDGDRFVAEVDVAYPAVRIAIELDGRVHLDAEVRERDLPRQNDLVLLGWTVLRFSWRRFAEHPDAVISEVRAALRRAAAAA